MKPLLKTFIILCLLCHVSSLYSSEKKKTLEVTCSHLQICRLLEWGLDHEYLKKEKNTLITTNYPEGLTTGDPHHFEPSTGEIKELLSSPILITPSSELQPWIQSIIQARQRNEDLQTLTLKINNYKKYYESATNESLAHFWLFPEGVCEGFRQIKSFIDDQIGFIKEDMHSKVQHRCEFYKKKIQTALKKYNENIGGPIIISHDALTPHLRAQNVDYVILRGGGHGERINSKNIKRLEEALKESNDKPLIWIDEHQIFKNSQLSSRKRDFDHILELLTDGPTKHIKSDPKSSYSDFFHPLTSFTDFIETFSKGKM